jgi:hypothetical protein
MIKTQIANDKTQIANDKTQIANDKNANCNMCFSYVA